MAEIQESIAGQRRQRGVRKSPHAFIRIDMTSIVDLGFLLITFFVMSAELSRPVVTKLNMPKDAPGVPPTMLGESNALTILLDEGERCYYYAGTWEKAIADNKVLSTDLSLKNGFGNRIREMQAKLDHSGEGRNGLMVMIKPGAGTDYRTVINSLDEMLINGVTKYVIMKQEKEETAFLAAK